MNQFLTVLTILLAAAAAAEPVSRAETLPSGSVDVRPNIVVVLTDDLSIDLTNALLAAGLMPNLQQYLIDEGASFTESFVTNALCCPSRATFLRGQYSHNHAVRYNRLGCEMNGISLPGWFSNGGNPGRNESTVATWLQAAGYFTGHIGRYLNGYGVNAPEGIVDPTLYVPPGWDDWQGLVDPTTFTVYDYLLNDNGVIASYGDAEEDYQTDVLADRAVTFINERAVAVGPFFLTVATFAPHVELPPDLAESPPCGPGGDTIIPIIRPAPRHLHMIDGDPDNGEIPDLVLKPSFNEADVSDKPDCKNTGQLNRAICVGALPRFPDSRVDAIKSQFKSMGAAMLAVDDLIGALWSEVQRQGLADNTVLVFTSDNGWSFGEHRVNTKVVPYEEAIRVPLYVRSPGTPGGATVADVVLNNDLAPTIAALARAEPTYDPDGTSIVPLLSTPTPQWGRQRFFLEHLYAQPIQDFATYRAVRMKSPRDLIYIATFSDPLDETVITHREFYDLGIDPFQMNSADLDPTVTSAFESLLLLLQRCAGRQCRFIEGMDNRRP